MKTMLRVETGTVEGCAVSMTTIHVPLSTLQDYAFDDRCSMVMIFTSVTVMDLLSFLSRVRQSGIAP